MSVPVVAVSRRRSGCRGRCGSGAVSVCIIAGLGGVGLPLSFGIALTSTSTAATTAISLIVSSVAFTVGLECKPSTGLGVGREGGVLGHEILDKVFVLACGHVCVCGFPCIELGITLKGRFEPLNFGDVANLVGDFLKDIVV